MCIYCTKEADVHNLAAQVSFHGPPPPFSSLQLSQDDFDLYLSTAHSQAISNVNHRIRLSHIRVTSSSPDVQDALRNASESGEAAVESIYYIMDPVLSVMLRLEKKIRVPMKYWILAGDGVVYSPGDDTTHLDIFKKARQQGNPPAELRLLSVWEVEKWASANVRN